MKLITNRLTKKRFFTGILIFIVFTSFSYAIHDQFIKVKNVVASIEPWNFTAMPVNDIYVNEQWGGAVHSHSGGGGSVCCTLIPKVWRKDLSVKIRWQTDDEKWHATMAPIPRYDKPAALQILFLPNDKVQIYVNHYWPCSAPHPMPKAIELCKELGTND